MTASHQGRHFYRAYRIHTAHYAIRSCFRPLWSYQSGPANLDSPIWTVQSGATLTNPSTQFLGRCQVYQGNSLVRPIWSYQFVAYYSVIVMGHKPFYEGGRQNCCKVTIYNKCLRAAGVRRQVNAIQINRWRLNIGIMHLPKTTNHH